MSDFLVAFGERFSGEALLNILRLPYGGGPSRQGHALGFKWGNAAVLCEPLLARRNVFGGDTGSFACVGDLVVRDVEQLARGLLAGVGELRSDRNGNRRRLERDPWFEKLNGAFAILLADDDGLSVITDPLGSVQVYAGRNRKGALTAIGTHPDLVALVAEESYEVDPVSVFEFLAAGTPCFPHTMHARVTELAPGRLHMVIRGEDGQPELEDAAWWPFPRELDQAPEDEDLAAQMAKHFVAAVKDRCVDESVGVTLSGGLDSRLVMAAVPDSVRCLGFTFCDAINREAQTARRVAQCYGRPWVPLFRDSDYIARTALETIRFIGCEGDWVNAHGMGFVKEMAQYEVRTVLSGLLMNNNVKGFYAADVVRVPRGKGLLPPRYDVVPYDYVNELKAFDPPAFRKGLLESARARRKHFLEGHPGLKRRSVAEWLDGYPFSQAPDNTGWVAERRLMPVRLPAMDRRLLDIACTVPINRKIGGRLFARMAMPILGKGANIPDANDGVRPGSSHIWRLLQRSLRKVENNRRELLERMGVTVPVPTSWHDYQRYWRESRLLRELASQHEKDLQELEGTVFEVKPRQLLQDRGLSWLHGFRLVQLGIWKAVLQDYRSAERTAETRSGPTRMIGV